jgi:small subunit ribosomal protein S1
MSSQFAELLEQSVKDVKEGELAKGVVVALRSKEAVVDIGYKAEGIISLDEFSSPGDVKIGMELEVLFESFDDVEGVAILSKRKADRQRTWNRLVEDSDEGSIVQGKIFKKVRGGFMVDIGMEAFLPASLVDVKPTRNLDQFIGIESKFVIAKINHKRKNIVVSRKDFLDKERAGARVKKLEVLKEGDVVKGKVKNITDFGVFVDLGDLDGLLHITDMSWGRVAHPSELVKLGDEIQVAIIGIDRTTNKVSLGMKQKSQDPWQGIESKYSVGTQVTGKVVNILQYGAFVELEPGVEGLVHISELSWTKRVTHPSEILTVGEAVEVVVLNLDKDGKKISLGLKQTQENPWLQVQEKYSAGTKSKGVVRNLTDYGAFIELEPGVDGLVHISDLSWTHKVVRPSEILKKGEEVQVMVLSIDTTSQKISLGIKQLTEDPWESLTKNLPSGLSMKGKITRVVNFGLFVELDNGLEGLVHVSEVPESQAADLEKHYNVGEEINVSILNVDHEARKIALTCKNEESAKS